MKARPIKARRLEAAGRPCGICDRTMSHLTRRGLLADPPSRHPTFDHFLPSEHRNGMHIPDHRHRAGRMVCRSCNGLRADAGHCVAALACYAAVVGTWDEAELRPAMLRLMREARERAVLRAGFEWSRDRAAAWAEP